MSEGGRARHRRGFRVPPSNGGALKWLLELFCVSRFFLPASRILALTFSRAPFPPRLRPAGSRGARPHKRRLGGMAGDPRGFALTTYNQFFCLQHITIFWCVLRNATDNIFNFGDDFFQKTGSNKLVMVICCKRFSLSKPLTTYNHNQLFFKKKTMFF